MTVLVWKCMGAVLCVSGDTPCTWTYSVCLHRTEGKHNVCVQLALGLLFLYSQVTIGRQSLNTRLQGVCCVWGGAVCVSSPEECFPWRARRPSGRGSSHRNSSTIRQILLSNSGCTCVAGRCSTCQDKCVLPKKECEVFQLLLWEYSVYKPCSDEHTRYEWRKSFLFLSTWCLLLWKSAVGWNAPEY